MNSDNPFDEIDQLVAAGEVDGANERLMQIMQDGESPHSDRVTAANRLGRDQLIRGLTLDAYRSFSVAHFMASPEMRAEIELDLGQVESQLGATTDDVVFDRLDKAAELFEAMDDRNSLALARSQRAFESTRRETFSLDEITSILDQAMLDVSTSNRSAYVRVHATAGKFFSDSEDYPRAEEALQRALEANVNGPGNHTSNICLHLGDLYLVQLDLDRAEAQYSSALASAQTNEPRYPLNMAQARIGLAWTALERRNYELAEQHLEAAIGLGSENAALGVKTIIEAHYSLGIARVLLLRVRNRESKERDNDLNRAEQLLAAALPHFKHGKPLVDTPMSSHTVLLATRAAVRDEKFSVTRVDSDFAAAREAASESLTRNQEIICRLIEAESYLRNREEGRVLAEQCLTEATTLAEELGASGWVNRALAIQQTRKRATNEIADSAIASGEVSWTFVAGTAYESKDPREATAKGELEWPILGTVSLVGGHALAFNLLWLGWISGSPVLLEDLYAAAEKLSESRSLGGLFGKKSKLIRYIVKAAENDGTQKVSFYTLSLYPKRKR